MSLISVRFFSSIQSAIEYHDRDLQQRLAWWISAFAFNLKLPLCQVMVITTDRVCICIGGGEGRELMINGGQVSLHSMSMSRDAGFSVLPRDKYRYFLPKQTN